MPQEPMFVPEVEKTFPAGKRGDLLRESIAAGATVSQIYHLFAWNPARNAHISKFTDDLLRGPSPLSRGQREWIGALTSRLNSCKHCERSHAAGSAELLGDRALVEAILDNPEKAPITPAEKALARLVTKAATAAWTMTRADLDTARAAGWTDEALYDALSITALFRFFNTWCDSLGVHALPEESHRLAGQRIKEHGYVWE